MRYAARIPEVDRQTEVRTTQAYCLADMQQLDGSKQPGVWLAKSYVEPRWHPIETHMQGVGSPSESIIRACQRTIGITPRILDTLLVVSPSDHEAVRRTTFIHAAVGRAAVQPNAALPRPIVGTQLGLFPINDLPLKDMRPADAHFAPPQLTRLLEEGYSMMAMQHIGNRNEQWR